MGSRQPPVEPPAQPERQLTPLEQELLEEVQARHPSLSRETILELIDAS